MEGELEKLLTISVTIKLKFIIIFKWFNNLSDYLFLFTSKN